MVAKEFAGEPYSILKARLAEAIAEHLSDFRSRKKALLAKPATIRKVIDAGSKKTAVIAEKKIAAVKKKVGL